jgi:hypothetical protein
VPIKIVDSNYLRSPELVTYLEASVSNKVALASPVQLEMFKTNAVSTLIGSLEHLRKHHRQVLVLRPVADIYSQPFQSAAAVRTMIDRKQTALLPRYYDLLLTIDKSASMTRQLAEQQKEAEDQFSDLLIQAGHIQPIFTKLLKRFTRDELNQLRTRTPYSAATQVKLLTLMYDLSRDMFIETGVAIEKIPFLNLHALHYFIFRYAMCMVIVYTRWVHVGRPLATKSAKLANDIVDMHVAALGTFFSGVLSNDARLMAVSDEARYLLRVMPTYVG